MQLTDRQIGAMQELLRRGELTGRRGDAARELIRRHMKANGADIGKGDHDIATVLNSFADTATLGLSNYGEAGVAALGAKLGLFGKGAQQQEFGTLFSTALDLASKRDENLTADNPYSSLAGTVGGALAGGAVAGRAAAKAGFRPAKSFAGRAGQYAGAGAGAGAAEQMIGDQQAIPGVNTLVAGTVGGLAGGVGGAVVDKALPAITPYAGPAYKAAKNVVTRKPIGSGVVAPKVSRAWRKLAAKLRTPVDDMEAFIADTKAATGQMPSIAQAIHARDQGLLQGWAARHNTFGTKFNEAAEAAPGLDLNVGKLEAFRDNQATATMNRTRPLGTTVRDTEIDLPPDLLGDPSFNRAVPRTMRQKIASAEAGGARLTVGEADIIRRRLRRMESSPANLGEDFKDVADELEMHAGDQVGEYRQMIRDYKGASDFGRGFEEAMAGRSATEGTGAAGRSVRRTAEGAAGHSAGAYTRKGQQTLRRIAPGTPADDDFPDAGALGRGVAHLTAGSRPLGVFHTTRAFMDNLPEAAQKELGEGLSARDPARIHATLGNLRKAGTDLQTIRQLSLGLSGILGASTSRAAGAEQPR